MTPLLHKASICGALEFIGDKSIAHRFAILTAIGQNEAGAKNFPRSKDCLSTLSCLSALGAEASFIGDKLVVKPSPFTQSARLDVGNSATTARLLCGVLAGQKGDFTLVGDRSLMRRPMERVAAPLRQMGAKVETADGCCPVSITGAPLSGITYTLPVASAQVKSAVLLAGLKASGTTTVIERSVTRDHTERMLRHFHAPIETSGLKTAVSSGPLYPQDLTIPGDLSSAAYFLCAALLLKNSRFTARNVTLNPGRVGFLHVLLRMGAELHIEGAGGFEPCGDVTARSSALKGTTIPAQEVPSCIDELPLLCALASTAEGETLIQGAGELRLKESDRLSAICLELKKCGALIEQQGDDIYIRGSKDLHPAAFCAYGDHRLAMTFAVLALALNEGSYLDDLSCVDISYPDFLQNLYALCGG